MFGFPAHGSMRESLSAYVLGSAELPYETLAGSAQEWGNADGVGQQARFSYPTAISLWNDSLLVTDRDNNSLRRVDINNGDTTTVLKSLDQPSGMTAIGDTVYITTRKGISVIEVAKCADQSWTGCAAKNIAFKGGASAITNDGKTLYLVSTKGVFAVDPSTGSAKRIMAASNALIAVGGAAWWEGHLYISDYYRRVIYRLSLSPAAAKLATVSEPKRKAAKYQPSIRRQVTTDGVLLTAKLKHAPADIKYQWDIKASGCQAINQPDQSVLVACPTPTTGQATLTATSKQGAGRPVSRKLRFR
jgi:hypothetical protein